MELSCELDYAISFWLWILLWKCLHFVEISTFCGHYPHFVEISTFRRYYPHFVYISLFCGDYPPSVDIIRILWKYPYFMEIIRISWKYPRSVNIIRVSSILSLTFYSSIESDWCITSFPVCNLIFFIFPIPFALFVL